MMNGVGVLTYAPVAQPQTNIVNTQVVRTVEQGQIPLTSKISEKVSEKSKRSVKKVKKVSSNSSNNSSILRDSSSDAPAINIKTVDSES